MRKLLVYLICLGLLLSFSGNSVYAYDVSEAENAYLKIREYYKNKSLVNMDDVISYEALGYEAEERSDGYTVTEEDAEYAGGSAKAVVTIALLGQDPNSYNGMNYVDTMMSHVKSDGSISDSYGASDDVWFLFALYVISSDQLKSVTDHYVNTYEAKDLNSWTYGEYSGHSLDITGWSIMALSLIDKDSYKSYIEEAITAMKDLSKNNEDGGYADPYSTNPDTQASVLEGLLTYDRDGVMNDKYNIKDIHPMKTLLSYQLDNGSFYYSNQEENPLATRDSAWALGVYKNGSFIEDAKNEYNDPLKDRYNNLLDAYKDLLNKKEEISKQDYNKLLKAYKKAVASLNTRIKSVKGYKNKVKITYTKVKGVKYQIGYRLKGIKWKYIKTNKTKYTIKKLRSKRKYQVRVRPYTTYNKKYYYGKWSKRKTVKTK